MANRHITNTLINYLSFLSKALIVLSFLGKVNSIHPLSFLHIPALSRIALMAKIGSKVDCPFE